MGAAVIPGGIFDVERKLAGVYGPGVTIAPTFDEGGFRWHEDDYGHGLTGRLRSCR